MAPIATFDFWRIMQTLLKQLRKARGFTQQYLAFVHRKGFCVTQPEISQLELGITDGFSKTRLNAALERFAKVLGWDGDPYDLLEFVD